MTLLLLRRTSPFVALFGHGAMSDLSPLCEQKRTSANHFETVVHALTRGRARSFDSPPDKPAKIVSGAQARSAIVMLFGHALVTMVQESACQMGGLLGVECRA
jgi:hypothetical protein